MALDGKIFEIQTDEAINIPVLTLAYLGDAVYELRVREYFVKKGIYKTAQLHEKVIPLVSAAGQSALWDKIMPLLDEKDIAVMKRGRNAKSPHSRSCVAVAEYRRATGLETLIGYWYINHENEKLDILFSCLFEEETK